MSGGIVTAWGVAPEHYAANSVLSEGQWRRVEISRTGMHLVTDADLRSMGFSDPSKVRVYGTGGRAVSDCLNAGTPDDLPLLPSARTDKGLVFYAVDHFQWTSTGSSTTPYSHTIHPYSDKSYYFLSDRDVEAADMPTAATKAAKAKTSNTDFMERLVHEQELDHPGSSGFLLLGEDFRSNKNQTFSFSLPGATDGAANVRVRFGAKTTSGSSSLMFTANGERLPSTASDKIAGVASTDYIGYTTTVKTAKNLDGQLDLGIEYTYSGALFTSRLDWIEVFYRRSIAIADNGEIAFYATCRPGQGFTVAGATSDTQIWDITVPSAPKRVEYLLEGSEASFTVNTTGHREFVAFNPGAVTRKVSTANVGRVANQNIHALETPDMVIITHPEYVEGAKRIAALHEEVDGMRVHVLYPEDIYLEFSGGKQDVGAFRKMLKMWYDRGESADGHKIGYCLLMGKPTFDNKLVTAQVRGAGYKPLPIYQSITGNSEVTTYSTDDYLAMIDDTRDGAFSITASRLRLAVGRIPVTDAKESLEMAAKIEKYVKDPNYGAWRNKVMIIADDGDNGQHLDQAQAVYNAYRSKGNGKDYVYDRVYLDQWPLVMTSTGATYPQATARVKKNFNDGVLITNYIGHASATGWGHEKLFTWSDMNSMTNPNYTFLYAATCEFAFWDDTKRSGAEVMLMYPDAGIIGMMGATRTVYISMNGVLNRLTCNNFFDIAADGRAQRLGDVYIKGKNAYSGDSNRLRYAFMGDPAIRIPGGSHSVAIRSINGVATDSDAESPVIPALGRAEIEGEIVNRDGTPAADFNGTVNIKLFDAERVVTTYGNGDEGRVSTYNDRNTVLSTINATVTDGKWKATLMLPSEIEGNYSPAMVSAYAWDGKGTEANGSTERLYVYGFDETAGNDTIGPEIQKFYVNHENFKSGDLVNSNPVVFATVRDDSGINISEGGIGHSITLTVDGQTHHSDLNSYFDSDMEEMGKGSVVYPLEGLTPGRHSLQLTVWDNVGNVSRSELEVNVGAAVDPVIRDIYTDCNPAREAVVFSILLDRPNTAMKCRIGVYDLMGRKVWEYDQSSNTDLSSTLQARWNLTDRGGTRVPRGIYLFKAEVETPEGTYSSKSKKIAVAAQ